MHDREVCYLVETTAAPLGGALVLAEGEDGNPLVTATWDHPNPEEWEVTNFGSPLTGSEFNRFDPEELQSLFSVIAEFDHLEVAA